MRAAPASTKIHSICLVKNESDIVVQTLTAAARWSDFIYVYDNGSTDGTWEKLVALSHTLPQIVLFAHRDAPFHDSLRREPFDHYRDRSAQGDWGCRLDADEIYIDDPRAFLAGVPARFDAVWAAVFQYYFTDRDADRFAVQPEAYADNVPVEEKCSYYLNNWSTIKFFRYSARLRWESGGRPAPLRRSYPRRIRVKHYQYRSPRQIESRWTTRRDAMDRRQFAHETRANWTWGIVEHDQRPRGDRRLPESWKERVVDSSRLIHDTGGDYVVAEAELPRIVDPDPSLWRRASWRLGRMLATVPRGLTRRLARRVAAP